jgi:predicted molibdopterin-dependent oxidoreductase YjgC
VLPATSYLERDGTSMNLEGRLQRQRRAVIPPCPDESAWLAQLASRLGIEVSPHPALVFDELSERIYGGVAEAAVGGQAPLPERVPYAAPDAATTPEPPPAVDAEGPFLGTLQLVRYRPLFSGPAVERVPELQFQRPEPVLELAQEDAERRQIADGTAVEVRSAGETLALRARIRRRLMPGVAYIAEEHARDLGRDVEVVAIPIALSTAGGESDS